MHRTVATLHVIKPGAIPIQTQINPLHLEALTRFNVTDMLENFGLNELRRGRAALERLCLPAARLLAHQAAGFDARVGEAGLQVAAREWLQPYIRQLEIVGAEHVPAEDGMLLAVNHPGMIDSLVCFAGTSRTDLRLVSLDRPFVRQLENMAQRTFFVPEDAQGRLLIVRQVARFLQRGGAVLLCPAGQIEPDPAVMPGAIESLEQWSDSLGMFVRLAPQAVVVPAVVSGVIYEPSLRHPLTRLRRAQKDRARVAATLQVIWQSRGRITRHMRPRLEFGEPLRAADLIGLGDTAAITQAITAAERVLIERVIGERVAHSKNQTRPRIRILS